MFKYLTNSQIVYGSDSSVSESKTQVYRNLTVSPCGRSAGTVPEPPELDTKDEIMLRTN